MGQADFYSPGDWNAICFRCGRKHKASTLLRQWQGYYVCRECWEPRHPQDFVRPVPDVQTVPWAQPPSESFVSIPALPVFCTPMTQLSRAGLAVAGCAIVGSI